MAKLTKINTLKLAVNYISTLTKILEQTDGHHFGDDQTLDRRLTSLSSDHRIKQSVLDESERFSLFQKQTVYDLNNDHHQHQKVIKNFPSANISFEIGSIKTRDRNVNRFDDDDSLQLHKSNNIDIMNHHRCSLTLFDAEQDDRCYLDRNDCQQMENFGFKSIETDRFRVNDFHMNIDNNESMINRVSRNDRIHQVNHNTYNQDLSSGRNRDHRYLQDDHTHHPALVTRSNDDEKLNINPPLELHSSSIIEKIITDTSTTINTGSMINVKDHQHHRRMDKSNKSICDNHAASASTSTSTLSLSSNSNSNLDIQTHSIDAIENDLNHIDKILLDDLDSLFEEFDSSIIR